LDWRIVDFPALITVTEELENYYLPGALEPAVEAFVEHY
jgi:hypothetical protein